MVGAGTTWDSQFPVLTIGADLLTDGAMENWTGDDLDSWAESGADAAEDVAGQTGSAAQLTTIGANGAVLQTPVVVAETKYILKGYYKNTAGDQAMFRVYDVIGGVELTPEYNSSYVPLDDSVGAYTAFSYIFDTPVGCTVVMISLGGVGAGDVVWFDTVSLKRVDEVNSAKWDDVSGSSWTNIFSLDGGPSVTMRIYYGQTSPPANYVDKMEILSAIVTNTRYLQAEITITDPAPEIHAYVEEFYLRFCQPS